MSTDYYTQENHGPFELVNIGTLELEEGGILPECQLAIATHGTLNTARDNAILIPTWYSGTNKIMSDIYIGPGRALDPEKYFIIIINQIGNGLSTSPNNIGGALAGPDFPKVRISDDVRAQYRLLTEHYGLEQLALVTGGSMGAQQTYEWAVRYPEFVQRAAPIAGTAKSTEHFFMFLSTLSEAVTSDPGFSGGHYRTKDDVLAGLSRQARIWTVMGWSTDFFRADRHRALGFDSMQAFVDNFMIGYFSQHDPNCLLTMAWKCKHADVSRHTGGDLAAALARIKARVHVMPISHDMFFPPADCKVEQQLIANSQFRPLDSICGHLGLFGVDQAMLDQLDQHLKELLETPV